MVMANAKNSRGDPESAAYGRMAQVVNQQHETGHDADGHQYVGVRQAAEHHLIHGDAEQSGQQHARNPFNKHSGQGVEKQDSQTANTAAHCCQSELIRSTEGLEQIAQRHNDQR